jgi:hypothetical protein
MSGMRATTPMKSDLARQIRATAGKVDESHPEMSAAGQHLRKAATLVQSGMHDGAKRHLDAAMELMTPRNLIRHGIRDDEGHARAKMAMHQANVHRLGVMDIQDTEARNAQQASAKRDSIAQLAQQRAAKLQAAATAKQQTATAQAAAKQAATEQKTAAKPTGTGPGSQQQSGPQPDPILATAVPTRGGIALGWHFNPAEHRGAGGQWSAASDAAHAQAINAIGDEHTSYPVKTATYNASQALREGRYHDAAGHIAKARSALAQSSGQGLSDHMRKQKLAELDRHAAYVNSVSTGSHGRYDPAYTAQLERQNKVVQFSAQTAALEVTPHPNGKPGGPGLYGKAGNKHSDYFEQIVHALMTKRGMSQAQASAIAWSRLRKWSAGGGKVHPEVRAAAGKALGQEQAAKLSWEDTDRLIELACTVQLAGFNPAEARVPAGQAGGGQFGGGQGQPGGKGTRAQRRAKLVRQAVTLRGEITALLAQIHSATHKGKSKSSTPAKKGAAAISARQAAQSKAGTPARATAKTSAKSMTLAQMKTRLAALRAQLHTVTSEIHQLANEDRAAIELAASEAYRNAWRHELRGPHGQFVAGAGGPRASSLHGKAARAQWRAAHPDRVSPTIHKLDQLDLPSQVSPEAGEETKQAATRRALLAFTQKQLQAAIDTPVQQMDDHQLAVAIRVITSLTDHHVARLNENLAKVVTPPVADHVKRHLDGLRRELNRETQKDAKHALIFHVAMLLGAVGISLAAGGLGVPAGIVAIIAVAPGIAQELRDWRAAQQTIGNDEKVSGREVEKSLSSAGVLRQLDLAVRA